MFNFSKKTDAAIIPLKNNIAAQRKGILDVTRDLVELEKLPPKVTRYAVNMKNVVIWIITKMHLHGSPPDDIVYNLKTDEHPFFGNYINS